MMIEINNKSALRDSYTPGYGSGCGCGSRRYYTKDEVDALLAGIIDPDEIEQIINNLFEEYIEEGDLEQLIIDAIAGMYTNEEIDDMLAELEARIKTWVEEQGYLTDIDLTINGTTLHNGDSIDIEGGGGSDEYVKKSVIPEVVTREFLAVSPDNKITVRIKNTDTGVNTDYERYIKRINGIPLITQQKQDDIELPSYSYVDTEIRDSMEAETARTESTYMKDGGITINGTTLHNGDSMTISADTSNCVKKNTVPQVVTREFLAVSPDNKITVRLTDTDTGANTDYERYIKRINGVALITQTKQEDIELPSLDDYNYLIERIAALEEQVAYLSENCCVDPDTGDTPTPMNERKVEITYNVTSTTQNTTIVKNISGISSITTENGDAVPVSTSYRFSGTGAKKLIFTFQTGISPEQFISMNQIIGVKLSNNVSVGRQAFKYCHYLTGVTFESGSTSNPGVQAFASCTRLASVSGIETSKWGGIANGLFFGDQMLRQSFVFPNTITYIQAQAFQDTQITNVTIPSGVTNIGDGALYGITGWIRFVGTVPPQITESAFKALGLNCPIYVPSSAVDTYKTALPNYASRIQAWTGQ